MNRASRTFCLVVGILLCLPLGAAGTTAEETLMVTSHQQADDRDHPRAHLLPVVIPRPFHGGARVCAYYENDAYSEPQDGRVKLDVGLWRAGSRIARREFKRRSVRHNQLDLGCTVVPRLRRDDTLLFDFRFSDMPRLTPRTFSHGGLVNTYMLVRVTVEPLTERPKSTVELAGVEPAFGSRIPPGGRIKVRIAYTCGQPLGCNLVAGFAQPGIEWEWRWVPQGTRVRTLRVRCVTPGDGDEVNSGLRLYIERSRFDELDSARVDGSFTCLSDGAGAGSG